jgi:hypothetical protein
VYQYFTVVVRKNGVTLFGEEYFELSGICNIAIVGAEEMSFAAYFMGLGISLIHGAESSPAHLSAKDFTALFFDPQGLDQGRWCAYIFEQGDIVFIFCQKSGSGAIIAPVFQSFE